MIFKNRLFKKAWPIPAEAINTTYNWAYHFGFYKLIKRPIVKLLKPKVFQSMKYLR